MNGSQATVPTGTEKQTCVGESVMGSADVVDILYAEGFGGFAVCRSDKHSSFSTMF